MRSHLTHRLFRQLVSRTLYTDLPCTISSLSRHCLRQQCLPPTPRLSLGCAQQRRTLFGFTGRKKRQLKPAKYEPGYEVLQTLDERLKMGVRPPPAQDIAEALRQYVQHKRTGGRVEEIQADLLRIAFVYLENQFQEGTSDIRVSRSDIGFALFALSRRTTESFMSQAHIPLSEALFEQSKLHYDATVTGKNFDPKDTQFQEDIISHISVLAFYGKALEARDVVYEYWETQLKAKDWARSPWVPVVRGLMREGRELELEALIKDLQERNLPGYLKVHEEIIVYYTVHRTDMRKAKTWYQRIISGGRQPSRSTLERVLKVCMRERDLEWGDNILKTLLDGHSDHKNTWSLALQWAAAKGRGVDEIERMMKVNVRRNEGQPDLHPTIDMINSLAFQANENDDPYTAERYIALGQRWGLEPDALTYVIQLNYRIKVKDLAGAMVAYSLLRAQDLSEVDQVLCINRLIVAFCEQRSQNYDTIMSLVDDLTECKGDFSPTTVAALSSLHLQRGEMDDLQDLLNTHTFPFGLPDRESIRQVLMNHILDLKIPDISAWATYNTLRTVFHETPVPMRVEIMNSFFARNRPDMATHVFGHMRQAQIKEQRPTIDTYAACLVGIAKAGDVESLETVHNMSKLDNEIEPDTRIRNALMLGYTGCGDPSRALDFWNDIIHSREGPTYSSIQIALTACERAPFGERQAQKIWNRLKADEVEVTREIYAAFLGALAGQGQFDRCVGLCGGAEAEGLEVDALL